MGKVLKRVAFAAQTYRLALPVVHEEPVTAPRADVIAALEPMARASPPEVADDLEAARAEAQALLENARAQASDLLAQAREQIAALDEQSRAKADAAEEKARKRGFAQGQRDAQAAAAAQIDEMVRTMQQLVESARAERRKIVESAESELVRLALAIAERVVHEHVAVTPESVVEMARNALLRLVGRESVTVRVNPHDVDVLRAHRERLLTNHDIEGLRIVQDQRVDRGGVVIETKSGTIDAKISTQLREARRVLNAEEPVSPPPGAADTELLHVQPQAS